MLPRVRRLVVVLILAALPMLGAVPAGAQVDGACVVEINGVAVDRIDTLDSPLELETTDTLVFTGSSDAGTLQARVRLMLGPITIESGSSAYATAEPEFGTTISLDDVSPYGVGLFRVVAEADGCFAEAWVRVSGRFPLATLTGLTALGLALGGITGQLGAIVSRNRWARSAAALGGIATGTGIAVLAQQFGRLQVSYPSVAALAAVTAILGFVAAWLLNPAMREERLERRWAASPTSPTPTSGSPRSGDEPGAPSRVEEGTAIEETAAVPDVPEAAPVPQTRQGPPTTSDPPAAPTNTSPYWCYVMAPTDVFDLTDHTKTIATLVPGTWYLAKRTVGGWVHVVAADGDEGWVATGAIHRQG